MAFDTPPGDARTPVRRIGLPHVLAGTIAVQGLGTMAILAIPSLAPTVAASLDVPTSQVGFQVAIIYVAAMLASLVAAGLLVAAGPCRAGQISILVVGAGCLLAGFPHVAAIALGSFLIGVGYGLLNPAASELLVRHSPPHRRNLIFSIKQTGVPLGGVAAGLLGPSIAIAVGWSAVLWIIAFACVVLALIVQLGREELDQDGTARGKGGPGAFGALWAVLRHPPLRWLALSSLCLSAIQLCVVAFLVALLVEERRLDLVTAGAVLAMTQVAGAVGRILWGYVADVVSDGLAVLLALTLIMAAASAVVAFFGATAGLVPITLTFVVLGLTAIGWNGVYLSEVARLSPPREIGATTGAAMFFTFTGVFAGPAAFSLLHTYVGSYIGSYGLLVGMSLGSAAMIAAVRFGRHHSAPPR